MHVYVISMRRPQKISSADLRLQSSFDSFLHSISGSILCCYTAYSQARM